MFEPIGRLAYTPDDLFDGCWQRLDRAAEHRKAGTALWNEYLSPHPYDYTVIDNQDGTYVVRVTQDTPVPAELGILIGEWLYNLRATLDNVIWATAAHVAGTIPPPMPVNRYWANPSPLGDLGSSDRKAAH